MTQEEAIKEIYQTYYAIIQVLSDSCREVIESLDKKDQEKFVLMEKFECTLKALMYLSKKDNNIGML